VSAKQRAKKLVRSALVRAPGAYDLVTSQRRYVALYRLGLVHEPDYRALPLLLRGPSPLVLDVGANLGQTVLSVKRVLPTARIVCFEPNPQPAAALRQLQRTFPDLRIEAVALGEASCTREMYIPTYNGRVMSALASFDRESAEGWVGPHTIIGFRRDRLVVHRKQFTVRKLDGYRLSPDLIKLDVQGFEAQVLNGGLETLAKCRPILLVESPSDDVLLILKKWDYQMWEYTKGRLRPSTGLHMNQFLIPNQVPVA
jgi:FkbM family methyltransferase